MRKTIHIFLTSALLIGSSAFGLDNSIQQKSSQQTMIVEKDIALDKKSVRKNPRVEKAESIVAEKQNRVQFLMPLSRSMSQDQFLPKQLGVRSRSLPKSYLATIFVGRCQ